MKIRKTFGLILRTLKSLNRKEEIISLLLFLLIISSGYDLATGFKTKDEEVLPLRTIGEAVPVEGGALSEGLVGTGKRINPLFKEFNNVDGDIASLVFSGLSKYDPLQKKVVEDIATHTLSFDKKTYTFTIKDNAYWHDDNPVTSQDVYFTYHDVIQNPNFQNSILRSNFNGIEIKKINEKTVTFTLKEVNSFFFTNTTIGLLPYHILGAVPVEEIANHELNQFPIGTGPYKLAEPITNIKQEKNEMHLTVFEKYYGEKPNITDLRFTTFPDEETLFKAKKSLNALSKITSVEYIKELENKGNFKVYPYSLPQYTAVFFNTESPIMQNVKVRLALSKAIDKNELVSQLGYKIRIDTPLLELHQENWLHKTSKEEAMGALYDAGWRFEEGGIPEKTAIRKNENGQELYLIMIAQNFEQNPIRKKENEITIDFLKQAWESIGVKLTIDMLDNENFQEKIQKREYDLLLTGQGMGYNLDTYAFWHSSQANESGLNLSNYKSPIADNLIEAIRTTFDEETRLKKLQNLAETIQSDIPAIFLYSPVYYYAVDQKVKNIELGNLAQPWDRLTHIEKWYMKEKKIN